MSLDLGWGLGRRGASRRACRSRGGGTPLGAFLARPASPPCCCCFAPPGSPAESAAFRSRSPSGPTLARGRRLARTGRRGMGACARPPCSAPAAHARRQPQAGAQASDSFAPRALSLSKLPHVFSGAPGRRDPMAAGGRRRRSAARLASASPAGRPHAPPKEGTRGVNTRQGRYNDPSAGSPTETLLRLLLPLDAGARRASGHAGARPPDNSPQHPIGRSDGRCVQRAGTHSARDH